VLSLVMSQKMLRGIKERVERAVGADVHLVAKDVGGAFVARGANRVRT
jgi:hypothetical protein